MLIRIIMLRYYELVFQEAFERIIGTVKSYDLQHRVRTRVRQERHWVTKFKEAVPPAQRTSASLKFACLVPF